MAVPERAYDRLQNLWKRLGLSQEDVYYAIENDQLRVSVWMPMRYMERGVIKDGKFIYVTKQRKRADGTPYEITYLGTWNPEDTSKKIWVREDEVMEEIEEVFRQLQLTPEAIAEVMRYVRSGAGYEREYHKTRMESLYKEQTSIKTKLDRLMDFWLEGKITEAEHTEKRKSLVERRDLITVEIQQHNQADDKFSERLVDVVKIGGNAYEHFQLSNVEGKRRLVNLVFSTVKLKGRKLEYALRSPFNDFIKVEEMGEWRTRHDSNVRPSPSEGDALSS